MQGHPVTRFHCSLLDFLPHHCLLVFQYLVSVYKFAVVFIVVDELLVVCTKMASEAIYLTFYHHGCTDGSCSI